MNATPSPSSRFSCRVVRLWSALTGRDPGRHCAGCAECRAYFQGGDALESALRRDAGAWSQRTPEPSAGFESALLRAVREEAASRRPASGTTPWRGLLMSTAALAACVAIVAVGYRRVGPDRGDPSLADETAVVVEAVQTLSDRLVETVIPSAGAAVADNPLQREMSSIYSDARSAVSFLALNFLPAPDSAAAPTERRI